MSAVIIPSKNVSKFSIYGEIPIINHAVYKFSKFTFLICSDGNSSTDISRTPQCSVYAADLAKNDRLNIKQYLQKDNSNN